MGTLENRCRHTLHDFSQRSRHTLTVRTQCTKNRPQCHSYSSSPRLKRSQRNETVNTNFQSSRCINLELLGYAHTFKTSVYNQQRSVNNNKRLRIFPSGEKICNIIFSFFAVPPSQNYIFDHSKQLFFYNISSLNASFQGWLQGG